MKGLKCRHKTFQLKTLFLWLLAVFVFFSGFLLVSSSASATSLGFGGSIAFGTNSGYLRYGDVDNPTTIGANQSGNNVYFTNIPSGTDVVEFGLPLSSTLPGNSIVSFDITYQPSGTSWFNYYGLEFLDLSLIDEDCTWTFQTMAYTGTLDVKQVYSCHYLALSHADPQGSIHSLPKTRIVYNGSSTNSSTMTILFSPVTWRQINFNALTQDDKDWLESVMPAGTSTAQIQQATESAIEEQRQQEKEEYQEEATDVQDDIESNEDLLSITNTSTNLITVLSDIVNAISNPVKGSCVIPVDLSVYPGGSSYNVNVCYLSPPAGIVNVLNVIYVVFVIGLIISLIFGIIKLFKEATFN